MDDAEVPTPQEIAERCAEIRAGWTEAVRQKRLRVDLRPQYRRVDGGRQEIAADVYVQHHEKMG